MVETINNNTQIAVSLKEDPELLEAISDDQLDAIAEALDIDLDAAVREVKEAVRQKNASPLKKESVIVADHADSRTYDAGAVINFLVRRGVQRTVNSPAALFGLTWAFGAYDGIISIGNAELAWDFIWPFAIGFGLMTVIFYNLRS
jgi:hypothetical protein